MYSNFSICYRSIELVTYELTGYVEPKWRYLTYIITVGPMKDNPHVNLKTRRSGCCARTYISKSTRQKNQGKLPGKLGKQRKQGIRRQIFIRRLTRLEHDTRRNTEHKITMKEPPDDR